MASGLFGSHNGGMKQVFQEQTNLFSLSAWLSDDRLKLFINVEPILLPETGAQVAPPQPQVRVEDLLSVLRGRVKEEMLALDVLRDIAARLSKGETVSERRVAKGRAAIPGRPGKIVELVRIYGSKSRSNNRSASEESADLRRLYLFDNIIAGQAIARVYRPKVGEAGYTALGEELPASIGEPAKYRLGTGLQLQPCVNEPYDLIVADSVGYVVFQQNEYHVSEEFRVKGDLDYRTGSLDFLGKVVVVGDVQPGFTIKASKGIVVKGSLRQATLICSDGDVEITGSAIGGGDCYVSVAGELRLATAIDLQVVSHGDVMVKKELCGCKIRTQGIVSAERATIMGGNIATPYGVSASVFGNKAGLRTVIELCTTAEATREHFSLQERLSTQTQALKTLELHLGPFAQDPAKLKSLQPQGRERLKLLIKKLSELKAAQVRTESEIEQLEQGAQAAMQPRINYRKHLFSGLIVKVGAKEEHIIEDRDGPGAIVYEAEQGVFVHTKFSAINRSLVP